MRRGLKLPPARVLTFREFIDKVRPGFRWYRHCEVLAAVLQRVADGEIKRLMIFMAPRHGKSELVSRLFSAYWLHRRPHQWVGLNCYGAELAYGLSRHARDFYLASGGQVRGDAGAVKHWETGKGGGMWAAGVGGPILGKGWHLGIIDDPIKNAEESLSETIRAKQREWYSSTFYTREEPGDDGSPDGAIVVVQQRWHDDDLSGWLLAEEGSEDEDAEHWHVVNFEAIKENDPPKLPATCTLEPDWRSEGEALCPERRPIWKLRRIAARLGSYFFNALYQQRPRPRDGGMFQRSWFTVVGAAPIDAERVRYWDKAGTEGGSGARTAGVKMSRDKAGVFYIEHVIKGRWSALERESTILQAAELDGKRVKVWVEQEPGSGGKESAEASVRMLAGYRAHAERVTGDKVTRAEPFAAQAEARNVRIVRGDWNAEFLDELEVFPTGRTKDQVDAAGGAFNKLADARPGYRLFENVGGLGARR